MRKTFWDVPQDRLRPTLTVLSACFVLGGLLGCLLAAYVSAGGEDALSVYLDTYLTAIRAGTLNAPDPLAALWENLRYCTICALFGFTALGAFLIPALFLARGFLLTFAMASLVRRLGSGGLLLSFAALGIPAVMTVPPLFLLGVQGFLTARRMAGLETGERGHGAVYGRVYLRCVALCAVMGFLAFLYECRLAPLLLRSFAQYF